MQRPEFRRVWVRIRERQLPALFDSSGGGGVWIEHPVDDLSFVAISLTSDARARSTWESVDAVFDRLKSIFRYKHGAWVLPRRAAPSPRTKPKSVKIHASRW